MCVYWEYRPNGTVVADVWYRYHPTAISGTTHPLRAVPFDRYNGTIGAIFSPMHKQPVYAGATVYTNGVEEALFKVGFCLPAGPWVTDDDVRYIVDSIKEAIVKA